MSTAEYWLSETVVADWPITDPDGVFVPGVTVTGTVTLPDGVTSAAMNVTQLTDRYRATYDPTTSGLHAWRLVATGAADGAKEGLFLVRASLAGQPAITTDPGTDVGMTRLLINDVDSANPVFSDAEINGFLRFEQTVRRAAAQALDTIASNEVLVSKVIRTLDLQTDGAKVAAELRARAESLRVQDNEYDPDGTVYVGGVTDFDPSRWPWETP